MYQLCALKTVLGSNNNNNYNSIAINLFKSFENGERENKELSFVESKLRTRNGFYVN